MILTAAIDALEASIGDARQVESAGMAKAHIDRLFGVVRKGREIASARRVTLTSESMMVPNPVAQRLSGGAVACYDMRSDWIWLGESMAGKSQQLTTQLEVIHEVGHAHHLGGREVGRIASGCRDEWAGRIGRDLRLRLVAVTRERADEPGRPEEYRRKLRMEVWWTGVWEARWRRL